WVRIEVGLFVLADGAADECGDEHATELSHGALYSNHDATVTRAQLRIAARWRLQLPWGRLRRLQPTEGTYDDPHEGDVRQTPFIGVAHAFGGVEIDASLGEDAVVRARLDLGLPVVLATTASFEPKQPDGSYSEAQQVAADYKWVVAPHLFAVLAG